AALDDWAVCATDRDRRGWLLGGAREGEPGRRGGGGRVLGPAAWGGPAGPGGAFPTGSGGGAAGAPPLPPAAGGGGAGGRGGARLRRVQNEPPADFWVNLILGDALLGTAPVEAGGYYRAALASRPEAAVVYTALGDVLRAQKLRDAAMRNYRRAIEIDPGYAR